MGFTHLKLEAQLLFLHIFTLFRKWFKAKNITDYFYILLFSIAFLFTGTLDLLAKHLGGKNQRCYYQVSIMATLSEFSLI